MVPLVALASLAAGLAVGFGLWGRRVRALERERAQIEARLRAHVVPVLARRAAALDLPRDAADHPVEAAVEVARRIQAAEEKLTLPFTDTLEIHKVDLGTKKR